MMFKKISFAFLIFFLEMLSADSPAFSGNLPWLTGPLLTPSARVLGRGNMNVEPYFYSTFGTEIIEDGEEQTRSAKAYQFLSQIDLKVGVTDRINLCSNPQWAYNTLDRVSCSGFGDTTVALDYAIFKPDEALIALKFTLTEILPTGRYQHLNPQLLGTDIFGQGTYNTVIGLTGAKLFHFCGDHYLNVRVNIRGSIPSSVKVSGLNAYGGDESTRGTVNPGSFFDLYAAGEYTLTKNWALALDIAFQSSLESRFKGFTEVPVGLSSAAQFSLAPAIEYNWNHSIGLIVGTWFSVTGRQAKQFVSTVAALNMLF